MYASTAPDPQLRAVVDVDYLFWEGARAPLVVDTTGAVTCVALNVLLARWVIAFFVTLVVVAAHTLRVRVMNASPKQSTAPSFSSPIDIHNNPNESGHHEGSSTAPRQLIQHDAGGRREEQGNAMGLVSGPQGNSSGVLIHSPGLLYHNLTPALLHLRVSFMAIIQLIRPSSSLTPILNHSLLPRHQHFQ
ncbi:hypothetical protein BJ165DRAFT_1524263 [Panaeolus papilionaceus]|nr:hypothetical protein BJ165DRAFT_1524263 [Panaeolus papilionaceus]